MCQGYQTSRRYQSAHLIRCKLCMFCRYYVGKNSPWGKFCREKIAALPPPLPCPPRDQRWLTTCVIHGIISLRSGCSASSASSQNSAWRPSALGTLFSSLRKAICDPGGVSLLFARRICDFCGKRSPERVVPHPFSLPHPFFLL